MKSPMVSKCRNRAPTDTPARLVITAADARAYPTSMIVAMLASSSRATVSSRRCCCVLAISDLCEPWLTRAGPQVTTRLHGLSVAVAELAVAEHDCATHTRCHHCRVVTVDHPAQAAVERNLFLVIGIHRVVQAGGIDHDEVRAIAFPQRARVQAEPFGDFASQAIHRAFDGQERLAVPAG